MALIVPRPGPGGNLIGGDRMICQRHRRCRDCQAEDWRGSRGHRSRCGQTDPEGFGRLHSRRDQPGVAAKEERPWFWPLVRRRPISHRDAYRASIRWQRFATI